MVVDHLVGRSEELRLLDGALTEVELGRAAAIDLQGEPGIGKTRLLVELQERADARGALVLAGMAAEFERDLPFSVFLSALDEYLGGLDRSFFAGLSDSVRTELAYAFPSLSTLATAGRPAPRKERYRIHRAVRDLLEHVAETRPLVLVLDDLQWADAASVELIGALLGRPPSAAVLLAFAARAHQVPQRLSVAFERAHRMASLTRVELGVLSPEEGRELLGDDVDHATAKLLHEESGGNPFYLEQLARSLDATGGRTGALQESWITAVGVPTRVATALSEELALLSNNARRVLDGAAVAGDPFELELAAAAAAVAEPVAMDAVDELLGLDLLRSTHVPRRFRFRHPLVHRAVYEATAGAWRLGAHERCAEALAAQGAAPISRAHHVERSARVGDRVAVALLREAGESALRSAPTSAAHWFAQALRLLPGEAPAKERVALLLARADSLISGASFAEGHADLLDALEIVRRDAKDWQVRVTTACAAVEDALGRQRDAYRHLATALTEIGDAEPIEAVELMIELTVNQFHAADFGAMRVWAERAVAAASPLGERALLAAALAARAWAGALGEDREAESQCDEAAEVVDLVPDEELALRLNALVDLAAADLYLERFPAATRHSARALEIGRALRHVEPSPQLVAVLGASLAVRGRLSEAAELLDAAVEAARLAGTASSLGWILLNRSFTALVAGDLETALATAEESVELEDDLEQGPLRTLASAMLAAVSLEVGQPRRAVELLLTRAGGDELVLIGGSWRVRFLEVLTNALLAIDRRDDAGRAAAAAQASANAVALSSSRAIASLAAAVCDLDAGEPATAADRALAAAATLESAEALFDGARAREIAGRALSRAGDRERAVPELELAAAAFDSFGSLRYRDRVEQELRKLGHGIHRRTRRGDGSGIGIDSLTERELQVARLIVDRKTNREISGELFISQKTVETHIRNIFNKMGVSNRVALARTVEHVDRTGSRPPSQRKLSSPGRRVPSA